MQTSSQTQTPADFLRVLYLQRKNRSHAYSVSAFARDLGVSQPLLSLILNHKRALTIAQANRIAVLLDLSPKQSQDFLELAWQNLPTGARVSKKLLELKARQKKSAFASLDYALKPDLFQLAAQWYPLAILDLSTVEGFQSDSRWIAKTLGITHEEAQTAIQQLIQLGLLEKDAKGTLRKKQRYLSLPTKKSHSAIRSFHKKSIRRAEQILDQKNSENPVKNKISSTFMAVKLDRLDEAIERIEAFHKDFAQFVSDGSCQEVFQLNIQFFPITQIHSQQNKGDL